MVDCTNDEKFVRADENGQRTALKYILKAFDKCNDIKYEQHFKDKGRIDILLTATTVNNKEHWYAIECKDRNYDMDDFEEWIIELPKYQELLHYIHKGYSPIYFNTFNDGAMAWRVGRCKVYDIGDRMVSKYTVLNTPKRKTYKYGLKSEQAEWKSREILS